MASVVPAARRPARSRFFLYMTVLFLVIAVVGFSTTFFLPMARGTLRIPRFMHIHGLLLFGWLGFLILQAWLIDRRSHMTHRKLGWLGAGICTAIVVSGVQVGLHVTQRDLGTGADDFVLGQFVNILIEMLLFGGLVTAAIAMRRDREAHKRLLMLATISALAPAWLRMRHLFPAVPHPFVTFSLLADSLVLLVMARDRVVLGRIHPVSLWAGIGMIAVHGIELLAMRSRAWQSLALWLLP